MSKGDIMGKWLYIGSAIACVAFGGYVSYAATSWWWSGKLDKAVAEEVAKKEKAVKDERKICADNAAITKEANDELQREKDTIDARLADAKRRLRQREGIRACVPVARKANVGEGAAKLPEQRGVDAGNILDEAARCDKVAATLNVCIDFVDDVWAKSKQQ